MLGSISPVGEASRGQRWWLTASAYVVASAAGGAAVGLLLATLGWGLGQIVALSTPTRVALVALIALVGALTDAKLVPWRWPTWRRQVDESWLTTYRGWVYGAGFGFQLGTGVATIIPAAVTYVVLATALLTFSPRAGLLIGVVFGVVRSLPLLLAARLRSPAALYAATRRMEETAVLADRATVVGQLTVAAVAAAVVVASL